MHNTIPSLKTDPALLDALREGAGRKMTASEKFEQRVSFVFGSLSEKNDMTKEQVRQQLLDRQGIGGPVR